MITLDEGIYMMRVLGGCLFGVCFLHISLLNGIVFYKGIILKQKQPSWIPILGGILGVFSFLLLPVNILNRFWWLPLIIDMGSLPGMSMTAILLPLQKLKQYRFGKCEDQNKSTENDS